MCLVCLAYLQFLAMHTSDLQYNMMICACYGTTYVSLFISSLFHSLKFNISIPAVHAALYLLSVMDWATETRTCVQ